MESLFQDVRYGIRVLLKNPGFTLVAVLTLALGIGANTSIFSLINAVMLKMLPVADPEQLVVVGDPTEVNSRSMGDPSVSIFSHPLFKDLRAGNQVFSGLLASGAAHNVRVNVGGTEIPGALPVLVSGNYFSVLGVNPILGRVLTLDDDTVPGASPVAVVSHQFWIDKLARNPNVVGQTININRNPFTIVGVAPPDFFGDTVGENQDIWIPITMQQQVIGGRAWLENYNASWLHCIGRLKPGVNVEQARANLNVVLQQQVSGPLGAKLNKSDLGNLRKAKIQVSPGGGGFSELRGSFHEPLMLMMAIVGLVLVIACVNVANLLLARATARQKEIAVRLAIGAAPGRIIRQLLTESILLALAGGIVGVLIAQWATKGLLTLSGNPDLHASPDIRVLLFAAAVCLITGILFGLIPALRSGRMSVAPTLKPGSQQARTGGWQWGKILVASQVLLSLLVLFPAGLLVRSMQNMRTFDLGYEHGHLLLLRTDPLGAGYDLPKIANFGNEISSRVAHLPGVRAVSFSKNGLFSGSESGETLKIEGFVARTDADNDAASDNVGPNYFSAIGIPILVGRDIGVQDSASSPKIAVINETMAKFYFGNANPIGRRFVIDDDTIKNPAIEIVGVARDARDHEIRGAVSRRYYVPLSQATNTIPILNFEVRTSGSPSAMAEAARKEISAFDKNVQITRISTMNDLVDRKIANEILIARLASLFAALALVLACIGLYGIMSYSVTARTREIGVRMALGAQRTSVLWMVLREGMKLVLIGILIGIPVAFLTSQILSSMLFGLKATDVTSMGLVIIVLGVVAMLAGFVPARRATRVDPMITLRYE